MDKNKETQYIEEKVNNYISFVRDMWKKFKGIGEVIDESGDVTPMRVNTALAHFYPVYRGVNTEYRRQKLKLRYLELQYKAWESEKLDLAKKTVVEQYREIKGVKPSVKEFENQMRVDYRSEWLDWQTQLVEAEEMTKFFLDLREDLSKNHDILRTLSTNMRSEMQYLNLDYGMQEEINPYLHGEKRSERKRVPVS